LLAQTKEWDCVETEQDLPDDDRERDWQNQHRSLRGSTEVAQSGIVAA
jgi:hypothetical protein